MNPSSENGIALYLTTIVVPQQRRQNMKGLKERLSTMMNASKLSDSIEHDIDNKVAIGWSFERESMLLFVCSILASLLIGSFTGRWEIGFASLFTVTPLVYYWNLSRTIVDYSRVIEEARERNSELQKG